jgi:uncharacterized lipoprotein YmbA
MKPIRLVLLCGALAMTGCASSSNAPAMFLLDQHRPTEPQAPANEDSVLVVEPVRISPYLDESGIVYQTTAHRVAIANNNRWAAPLAGQLRDALESELAAALPGIRVQQRSDADRAGLRLATRVDAFMGHYDGHAHIAGHWQLMDADGATLLREPFQRRVALEEDGYDALVESLSSGWRANARELAPRIRTAMNSR